MYPIVEVVYVKKCRWWAVPRQRVTCCLAWLTMICRLLSRCDATSVNAVCRRLSARSSHCMNSTTTSSPTSRVSMLRLSAQSLSCTHPSASTTLHLCSCALRKPSTTDGLDRWQRNADDTTTLTIMTLITWLRRRRRHWCTRNRINRPGRRPPIIGVKLITAVNSLLLHAGTSMWILCIQNRGLWLHTFLSSV